MNTCVCGLPSDESCAALLSEVTAFEFAHLVPLGRLHQLTVDAYGAQHTGPDSLRLPYSLVGLHLALDLGATGTTVRTLHQRMGKAQPWWPRFVPPASRGILTIAAVADAGARTGAVDGHARAIDAWAQTVWTAWHSQHHAVAEFTRRLKSGVRVEP